MSDQDDQLARLQHRISQESSEKESHKLDTTQLRRIVELHIRQLVNLGGSSATPDALQRLRNSIKTFDAEVKVFAT